MLTVQVKKINVIRTKIIPSPIILHKIIKIKIIKNIEILTIYKPTLLSAERYIVIVIYTQYKGLRFMVWLQ